MYQRIIAALGVLALAVVGPAVAQDATGFSVAQAARGETPYRTNCGECHGVRFNGGMGPALNAETINANWTGYSAREFFDYVKENMPLGNPGGLTDDVYLDIVAHILSANGVPPVEGGPDVTLEGLSAITISPAN